MEVPMNKRFTHGVLLALFGCTAIALLPHGSGAAGLEDADTTAAITYNLGILKESLGEKGKPAKVDALKAQTAAWMIAAAAQSGGAARNPQFATIRDAATALAGAINDKKFDEAREQAKNLMTLKPDPAAKLAPVKIVDTGKAELEDIMNQFHGPRSGGLGIEDKLLDWETKLPDIKGATQVEMVQTANQLFIVFETARSINAPKKPAIKGTQAQWDKFADTARDLSRDLAETGRKADDKGAAKAIKDLNKTCTDCHKVFNPKAP
jgi:hypothetical protein